MLKVWLFVAVPLSPYRFFCLGPSNRPFLPGFTCPVPRGVDSTHRGIALTCWKHSGWSEDLEEGRLLHEFRDPGQRLCLPPPPRASGVGARAPATAGPASPPGRRAPGPLGTELTHVSPECQSPSGGRETRGPQSCGHTGQVSM